MYEAKIDFLWYKQGDKIKEEELTENVSKWIQSGFVDDVKEEVKKEVKVEEKVEESKPKAKPKKGKKR